MTEKGIKIVRIIAIVLATVTLLGVLIALTPKKTDLGAVGSGAATNVAAEGLRALDYALLYVQEGLLASYIGDSSTLTEATLGRNGAVTKVYEWKNFVLGGQAAILTSPDKWHAMKGGIGYKMTLEEWNTNNVSCEIPYDLSYSSLPEYEVELVCSVTGLTNKDGTPVVTSSEDYMYGVYNRFKSSFRFGLIHSFSSVTQQVGYGNLFNRWFVCNQSYAVHGDNVSADVGVKMVNAHERVIYNNGLLGKVVRLSVNRKVFSGHISDFVWYAVGAMQVDWGIVANVDPDSYLRFDSVAYNDQAAPFSVLNNYPGTLYALRLYERNLTEEERLQNYFVDACRFYSVNVARFMKMERDDFAAFAVKCGNDFKLNGVDMNVEEYAADRALLLQFISENLED